MMWWTLTFWVLGGDLVTGAPDGALGGGPKATVVVPGLGPPGPLEVRQGDVDVKNSILDSTIVIPLHTSLDS